MNQIVLDTIDGKPVSFEGELISQTEGNVEFTDGMERKFVLKVYAIESGGFVPSIEYFSNSTLEKTGCIAEIVDLFKDIENFYFVFVPEDLLTKASGKPRDEAHASRRLASALRKTYERLAFAYLDELSEALQKNVVDKEIAKTNDLDSN